MVFGMTVSPQLNREVFMNNFHKWIMIILLLLASLISYGYGFSKGASIFIGLGVILELLFCFGVVTKRKKSIDNN